MVWRPHLPVQGMVGCNWQWIIDIQCSSLEARSPIAIVVPLGNQSKIENRLRSELVDVVQVMA